MMLTVFLIFNKIKTKVKFISADNDDEDFYKTNTAELEDKLTACEMLVCYARELQGFLKSNH